MATRHPSDLVFSASADWLRILALTDTATGAATVSLQRWLERYVHPDDRPRVAAAIKTAARDKAPFELEHRSVRADGTVGTARLRAFPLGADEAEITEWLAVARHD